LPYTGAHRTFDELEDFVSDLERQISEATKHIDELAASQNQKRETIHILECCESMLSQYFSDHSQVSLISLSLSLFLSFLCVFCANQMMIDLKDLPKKIIICSLLFQPISILFFFSVLNPFHIFHSVEIFS
jgi:hypothetical protein